MRAELSSLERGDIKNQIIWELDQKDINKRVRSIEDLENFKKSFQN